MYDVDGKRFVRDLVSETRRDRVNTRVHNRCSVHRDDRSHCIDCNRTLGDRNRILGNRNRRYIRRGGHGRNRLCIRRSGHRSIRRRISGTHNRYNLKTRNR